MALDGSSAAHKKALLALAGIKKAKATQSTEAVVEQFEKVIADPKLDQSEGAEGLLRIKMAETLGALHDKTAVPVLIKAMEQTKENQPVAVHRAAATALGKIGDPSAIDALLTVTFRVPDAPTTTNIGERAKLALMAIGEPAIPKVLAMLKGEVSEVQDLAAKNSVPQLAIQQTAAGILGAMGAKSAVDDLIGFMPTDGCTGAAAPDEKKKKGDDEPDAEDAANASLRAVIANALGFIGDAKAVKPLCSCVLSTDNPGDMFPIMESLGRIGGTEAVTCLGDVIKSGKYDKDVVQPDFVLEPRWDAARFALLAAGPGDIAAIKAAIATNKDEKVIANAKKWDPGFALVESCKEDADCYMTTLKDVNADWIAREKAAFAVARAKKGDVKAAEEIAKAFKVRNPDARISMAWLPAHMLEGDTKCPACVDAYEAVLKAEKGSMDAKMQAPVLRVRATIAKLRDAKQADAEEEAAE